MQDLILAIVHHLAVFTLIGIFAAEFALIRPGLAGKRLGQLGKLDLAYGAVSGVVIVVGILRVILGNAGWEFYAGNWAFWAKMAAFLVVGLLSVPPTIQILRWSKSLRADAAFTPPDAEIRATRRFVHAEALFLLFIPIFAAMIPRIYGL